MSVNPPASKMLKDRVNYLQNLSVLAPEAADVIGISTYCGSPVVFGDDLFKAAEEKGIKNSTVFVMGGIFPPQDEPQLKEMGFSGVFASGPGSTREKIVSCIKNAVFSGKPA